jgi:hypothetical protein
VRHLSETARHRFHSLGKGAAGLATDEMGEQITIGNGIERTVEPR